MKEIICNAETGNSRIYIGKKISQISEFIGDDRAVIITDKNILKLYGHHFRQYPVIVIGTGEKKKTLSTVEYIIRKLLEFDCDRSSMLIGIGGGIVTDITGFAASVFLRGIKFGFVSTTLLSQVDASVGGKNGVNFGRFKNMVGVFRQPEFVICDSGLIATLPEKEYLSGLAEVIKHGFIRSKPLLKKLKEKRDLVIKRDPVILEDIVYECIDIKADVVQSDPKESGLRKILNFGHTFGHAVELISGVTHGAAVAYGMEVALRFSNHYNLITKTEMNDSIDLIDSYNIITKRLFNNEKLFNTLLHDKKRSSDSIDFILLDALGKAKIEKIKIDDLRRLYNDLCCSR